MERTYSRPLAQLSQRAYVAVADDSKIHGCHTDICRCCGHPRDDASIYRCRRSGSSGTCDANLTEIESANALCCDCSSRAIEQALLERSVHTKAGSLSGGQKRRLKIALELLVDRQLLFLDEPTSGLDASASLELVTLLKRLSRKVGGGRRWSNA